MPGRLEKWDQLVKQTSATMVRVFQRHLGIDGDFRDLDELMKVAEIQKNKERQRASLEAQKRTL